MLDARSGASETSPSLDSRAFSLGVNVLGVSAFGVGALAAGGAGA